MKEEQKEDTQLITKADLKSLKEQIKKEVVLDLIKETLTKSNRLKSSNYVTLNQEHVENLKTITESINQLPEIFKEMLLVITKTSKDVSEIKQKLGEE